MGWDTRHSDIFAQMLAPLCQGNIKRTSSCFSVVKEELIKVTHAEKQQSIAMLLFGGKILGHNGCGAGGCHQTGLAADSSAGKVSNTVLKVDTR